MVEPLADQQDGALELQIVDAERQRGRQNFDEELGTVVRLRGDEEPVFTDRPYFALNPVQRAERGREGGAEFGHGRKLARQCGMGRDYSPVSLLIPR